MSEDASAKVKASQHDSYNAYTLLSFLIPIIGVILSVAYMTKESKLDKKFGEHLLSIGIISIIFWSAAGAFLFWHSLPSTTYTAPISTYTPTPVISSWDYAAAYDKVQTGMTKAQVEAAIGKSSTDCSQTEIMGQVAESCTYGSYQDKGIVVVQYDNGLVSAKSKSSF